MVIIGNSEKINDHKLGHIIDGFDIVVRINEFEIESYEDRVGTKTDYVALGPHVLYRLEEFPNCRFLLFPPEVGKIEETYPEFDTQLLRVALRINTKKYTATTGLHVVNHFNTPEYDLYIHGMFDDGVSHYWNTEHEMTKRHDLDIDKEYIKNWGIRKLSDHYEGATLDTRNDFPALLNSLKLNENWVELGVAAGGYTSQLLKNQGGETVWSVDRWGDHHDMKEYLVALNRTKWYKNSQIIRATFDEALDQFEDNFFDFIYIDGYAHTGQAAGKTLKDWYPKLKNGGIFAGHDYHNKWSPTIVAVDLFTIKQSLKLNITCGDDMFPSWWVIK